MLRRTGAPRPLAYGLWLPLTGMVVVFVGVSRSRRRRKRFAVYFVLMLLGLWLDIACGGGLQGNGTGGNGQAGTPSGTYTMTVSGTTTLLPQQTAQVQLTVN